MLFSVEQAFVGRDTEKRAPLKTPAWEARSLGESDFIILRFQSRYGSLGSSDTSLRATRVRIRRVTDLHSAVHIDKHMITQEREGL